MRGYIYHITRDPEDLCGMDVTDFTESERTIACDYLENANQNTLDHILPDLMSQLRDAGFPVITPDNAAWPATNAPDCCAFLVPPMNDNTLKTAQMGWFKSKFEKLTAKLNELGLEDFSTDPFLANELCNTIDHRFQDGVYYDTGTGPAFMTLDRFIRALTPGVAFYVEKALVIMH